MVLYLITSTIACGILWYMCETSPIGYEDGDGFHFGDYNDGDNDGC